jgi:DNA replication and repair protein RecF
MDGGPWSIAAQVESPLGVNEIGTGRATDDGRERRIVRINGVPASNQAALGDLATVLWLTPAMDRLFQEGSSERRRFLDRLVLANDPAHVGRVTSYHQALKERSRLLRSGSADRAWLNAIEARAASAAIAIAAARRQTVRALSAVLASRI